MRHFKRTLVLVSVALLVAIMTTVSEFINYGQNNPDQITQGRDPSRPPQLQDQLPTALYESAEIADPVKRAIRKAKNARHDNSHFVYKNIPAGSAVKTTSFNDWEVGLPALPVLQSNLIVIGEVLGSEAHLSNDKSGIYSEFLTAVKDVVRNTSNLPVTSGLSITIERAGGAVLYPDGHKHIYEIAGQNMPLVNRHYVFFLNCAEKDQNCRIVTAYELTGNRVHPLDDIDTFEVYKGVEESKFLDTLRSSIKPHNGGI